MIKEQRRKLKEELRQKKYEEEKKIIPSRNDNCNNNNNHKIKIQLTSDNKCIIKSTLESAEKSKNTINKSEYSINIPDIKDINDNELLTLSKSNINNENDTNSNLLISFSNISELNKTGDNSFLFADKIKKLNENKENMNNNLDSFNNDIVNINFNDKSKCPDNSKSKDEKKGNNKIINFKKNIIKKVEPNKNNIINCKKVFKNIKPVNSDGVCIIKKKESKEINNNNFIPNHYQNFSFAGNNNNCNDFIKNDDYISPTFNVKINYNSLESNKNKISIKNETSRNKITNIQKLI